jgi:hypothetical protein
MTMQLKITNEDTARTALVYTINRGGAPPVSTPDKLAPGKSMVVWVHNGKDIRIVEEQPEAKGAPPPEDEKTEG